MLAAGGAALDTCTAVTRTVLVRRAAAALGVGAGALKAAGAARVGATSCAAFSPRGEPAFPTKACTSAGWTPSETSSLPALLGVA